MHSYTLKTNRLKTRTASEYKQAKDKQNKYKQTDNKQTKKINKQTKKN